MQNKLTEKINDLKNKDKKIILLAFGTRPEIIKLFVLYRILEESDEFLPILYNTAQQVISNDILSHLNIHNNVIARELKNRSTDLNEFVAHLLNDMNFHFNEKSALPKSRIGGVIVQGDTISAYSAATWAFLNEIPVFHVEAGLRTFDQKNPYPEEWCRESIARISDLNFCPTEINYNNLVKEGIRKEKNLIVGNTINDAIVTLINEKKIKYNENSDYILSTLHRRENWKNVYLYATILKKIIEKKINQSKIYHILHPNPLVRDSFYAALGKKEFENLVILNPVHDYFQMLGIVKNSVSILTDSGGIQEESLFFNIPCGILRTTTERPETLFNNGQLLPFENLKIEKFLAESLNSQASSGDNYNFTYGKGNTSNLIYEGLKNFYS